MCELLSNVSLFFGQLYADKSLALRARDLLCFTTDRLNSDKLLNLLELIYFLNNMGLYENYLICTFMNIHKNVENRGKNEGEKLQP